jgi:hypothetical protein
MILALFPPARPTQTDIDQAIIGEAGLLIGTVRVPDLEMRRWYP